MCSPKCSDEPKLFLPCFANRFQWFNPSAGCAAEATLWLARGFSDFAGPTWIAFHVGDSCVANSEPPGGFHGFHYGFHFLCPPSILDGIAFFKWSRLILIHFRDPNGLTFCQGGWTLYWAPLCRAQNQEILHGRLKRCLSSPFYTFLKTIKIQKKIMNNTHHKCHNCHNCHNHRIGWWENLQETPINLMVKTMVSCRFSLKPIHWHNCSTIVLTVQNCTRTEPGNPWASARPERSDRQVFVPRELCQAARGSNDFVVVNMIFGWDYYELLWSNYGKTTCFFFSFKHVSL